MAADPAATFAGAGLPAPPVPPALAASLEERGKWLWATRPPIAPAGAVVAYREELETAWPDDHLLIGHDGRGTSSWAISWYGVLGGVGILLRAAWGGPGEDPDGAAAAASRLAARFELIATIIAAAPGHSGRLAAVVDDVTGESGWAAWPAGAEPRWQTDASPLERVLTELT